MPSLRAHLRAPIVLWYAGPAQVGVRSLARLQSRCASIWLPSLTHTFTILHMPAMHLLDALLPLELERAPSKKYQNSFFFDIWPLFRVRQKLKEFRIAPKVTLEVNFTAALELERSVCNLPRTYQAITGQDCFMNFDVSWASIGSSWIEWARPDWKELRTPESGVQEFVYLIQLWLFLASQLVTHRTRMAFRNSSESEVRIAPDTVQRLQFRNSESKLKASHRILDANGAIKKSSSQKIQKIKRISGMKSYLLRDTLSPRCFYRTTDSAC